MKLLPYLSIFFIFHSCMSCKSYTEIISQEKCSIVVEIPPTKYPDLFKTKGYDPVTNKSKFCESDNRWWNLYKKEINAGDTIIKEKKKLTFSIHKKDTIITHEWKCYED
ncbi:hypothetical protein [Chryseobacterium sp. Bi04]|uniref:hypothetical protein n=1 Tax=Chryseobacterium sp. Bi04 TaxID=2822345 RepID=UPI001D48B9BD|nr:hypothetical protein [Chryseobacterium sp. Bi04]CAH0224041.1 hypothetical protein SRABI04_02548 [Chryseobacterium sp. Bi04]